MYLNNYVSRQTMRWIALDGFDLTADPQPYLST